MIELFNIDLLSYTVQTAETAPTHSYTIYWLILLGSMLLSWLVSARMKSRFSEYSQISIPVTGRQVAEQMLKDNHITDVKVISTPGHLTDHYNPADKTVNLSESVYNSNSIAAAAVTGFVTVAFMPLTYNISYGIAFGLISYVFVKIFTGKIKEINVGTWIISILFALMFFLTR